MYNIYMNYTVIGNHHHRSDGLFVLQEVEGDQEVLQEARQMPEKDILRFRLRNSGKLSSDYYIT